MSSIELPSQKIQENKLISISSPQTMNTRNKKGKRGLCICLSVFAVILTIALIILILALTVFKAKRPVTHVDSVSLSDLNFSLDAIRLRVTLNVTLDTTISVSNPNRVGFAYSDSTAYLRYRGNDVGEVPIPAGRIGARDMRKMNLTLTLMADRILSNSNLFSDATSGGIPFQTYIRIAGRVKILFDVHVVTYTTCDLDIDLLGRSISNHNCRYRTKL